jgi:hypothetical protein
MVRVNIIKNDASFHMFMGKIELVTMHPYLIFLIIIVKPLIAITIYKIFNPIKIDWDIEFIK